MSAPSPRILVTHPGRQHSHQMALALARSGLLAGYWSGIPSLPRHRYGTPEALWRRVMRYGPVPLPEERVRWRPRVAVLRKLAQYLPRPLAERLDQAACNGFDRWVARQLPRLAPDAVIACETCAARTFRAARRAGITALLDAPSFHRAAQDRLHGFTESPAHHRRIARIKDREVALADGILTVSELARSTYLAAGVAAEKIHAVPLGADLELFSPRDEAAGPRTGSLVFLFAGARIRRKGFDLLLAAWKRVAREVPGAVLRVVGPGGDASGGLADPELPPVEVVGAVPQERLAEELRAADCLVLPSRNDSYGMVVAEALASGVPVLVSEMVGARGLVVEGRNGWVVPVEDREALTRRMLACARDPAAVRALSPQARASARAATWEAYHERFAELLRRLLERGR